MKKELFNELLQSVKEAAAIERGTFKASRTSEIRTAHEIKTPPLPIPEAVVSIGNAGDLPVPNQ